MRGETEVDSSENYLNTAGLVSNMQTMLFQIEASLLLTGRAYWKREKNPAGYGKLRHLDPTSLQLDEKKAQNGEIVWKRYENSVPKEYTPDEIIYFWMPDPYVEIGPPSAWPAKTALNACGVLANVDEFAASYFARGAIKAMIFSMSGASRDTAEAFEVWWKRWIAGIKNVFQTKVINADNVTPVVVGEGMKELENVTLTQEKREEVAQALDIPMSILFANAANYATAERDKLNWYEDTIVPEARLIAAILNDQVFGPLGLRFKFLPETLDIFQEDEKERSMALGYLVNAGMPLDIALNTLGFELADEDFVRIAKLIKKKEEQADELVSNLTQEPNESPVGGGAPEDPKDKPDPFVEKSIDDSHLKIGRELDIWQSKCLKAVKRGEPAQVDFIPVAIPGDVFKRVCDGLKDADTVDAVKDVFVNAMIEPKDELKDEPVGASLLGEIMFELSSIRSMVTNETVIN
jgi:hypothetical protein